MGQNPVFSGLKNPSNNQLEYGSVDLQGSSQLTSQGLRSQLNMTAAAVVKTGPGRLVKVSIISGGSTGGNFVFNDCATTGAATAANTIFELPFASTGFFVLDFPVVNGLVLSAVPTAGSPQVAISYT